MITVLEFERVDILMTVVGMICVRRLGPGYTVVYKHSIYKSFSGSFQVASATNFATPRFMSSISLPSALPLPAHLILQS
jgi:hypothetical protein